MITSCNFREWDATQSAAILKTHYPNPRTVRAAIEAAQRLGAKISKVEFSAFNAPVAMGNDMTAYCDNTTLSGKIATQQALEAATVLVNQQIPRILNCISRCTISIA